MPFQKARRVGSCQGTPAIVLEPGKCYDLLPEVTHVLIRPDGNNMARISFWQIPCHSDLKPKNRAGKYFYRPEGAVECQPRVDRNPAGFQYEVRWIFS